MSYFTILGIDETVDIKSIKRAYATLLKIYSPESHPEKFQEINNAYKLAVKHAKKWKKASQDKPITPVEIECFEEEIDENRSDTWLNESDESDSVGAHIEESTVEEKEIEVTLFDKLLALYNDFNQRINISAWQELLTQEILFSLSNEMDAKYEILNFVSNHNNLPFDIWLLIENTLKPSKSDDSSDFKSDEWMSSIAAKFELKRSFDYAYLNKMLSKDHDDFIEHYVAIKQALNKKSHAELGELFTYCETLCATHPSLCVLKAQYLYQRKDYVQSLEIYNELLKKEHNNLLIGEFYFERANVFRALQDSDKAEQDYLKALPLSENKREILLELVESYYYQHKYAKCIQYAKQYDNEYTENIMVETYRTNSYLAIINLAEEILSNPKRTEEEIYYLASAYYNCRRYEECYQLFKQYNLQASLVLECRLLYIKLLQIRSEYEKAIEIVEQIIESEKNNREIHLLKGEILLLANRYETLIQYWEDISPHFEMCKDIYIQLCEAYYSISNHKSALDYAELALALGENYQPILGMEQSYARAYHYKVKSLMGLGFYQDCINTCNEILEINRFETIAYSTKIEALYHLGLFAKVYELYEDAQQNIEMSSEIEYFKYASLFQEQKYEESIQYINNAIAIESTAKYHYTRGSALLHLKRYEEAMYDFDQTLYLEPNHIDALVNKGHLYTQIGELDKAVNILTQCIALDPSYPTPYLYRYVAYNKTGKLLQIMMDDLNKLIELAPDESGAYYERAVLYAKINKPHEALTDIEKALEIIPDYKPFHDFYNNLQQFFQIGAK